MSGLEKRERPWRTVEPLNYKQVSDKTAKQESHSVGEKTDSEANGWSKNQVYLPGSATNKVSGQKHVIGLRLLPL